MVSRTDRGFTIVELLIVIVVIGILAAITIVAFNGVQTRANNTKTLSTISQLEKLIRSYTATYNTYPLAGATSIGVCATVEIRCTNGGGGLNEANNSTLINELRKVGAPPQELNTNVSGRYGIQYIYEPDGTFNGVAAPIRLEYWLAGSQQKCGGQNVSNDALPAGVASTVGYTINETNPARTTCWTRIGLSL